MKLKNVKSLLAAALCAVGLSAAAGLVPVEYLDWDDVNKEMTNAVCTAYTVVTADMAAFDAGKTYVVMDDVSVSSCITVNGTAANPPRLILCDGAKLTAQGGVKVTVSGATTYALVICGQTLGTGALEATGVLRTAGIGGLSNDTPGESGHGGTVTINGGTVTATGGEQAAGIGGGWGGHGGTVTINGGTVTATGGKYGAGIGGGLFGDGGNVSINGGVVTATGGDTDAGGDTGAGIGKGSESSDDNDTVAFGAGNWLILAGDAAPGTDTTVEAYAADHSAKYVHIEIPEPEISALSNEFALDLTVGDRVAADEESLVVDPAWGDATSAKVMIDGEDAARTYASASIDTWETTALEPGRYALALAAGDDDEDAAFWKIGDDWVVFDGSNITADVTFEAGKTYLFFGTNTVDAMLTVTDGAKFAYDESAPAGFLGGTVNLPKRYEQKTVEGDLYQIVELIKGCEGNPWDVGEGVAAYTNGTDTLMIGGTGTVKDLSEIPSDVKDGLAAITVARSLVTGAEADAFAGLDGIALTLPDGWQGELPDKDGAWYGATGVTLTRMPLAVKNVKFAQRYPWNGMVDITCDLTGAGVAALNVTALTNNAPLCAVKSLMGETMVDLDAAGGVADGVKLVWNAMDDLPENFNANDVKVKVSLRSCIAIEPPELDEEDFTYEGEMLEISLRDDSSRDIGYTLSGDLSAKDAGEYTAIATLKGGFCWAGGSLGPVELTWRIERATVMVRPNDAMKAYSEDDPAFHVQVDGEVPGEEGTVKYNGPTREEGEDVGEYDIIVTGDEFQGNYEVIFEPGTFEIHQKRVSVSDIDVDPPLKVGTRLGDSVITGDTDDVEGKLSWADPDFVPTAADDGNEVVIVFTPDDTRNYCVVEVPVKLNLLDE